MCDVDRLVDAFGNGGTIHVVSSVEVRPKVTTMEVDLDAFAPSLPDVLLELRTSSTVVGEDEGLSRS